MLLNNRIEEPYNKIAPDGPLPTLSKTMVKSKLTQKFWKITQHIYDDNNKNHNNDKDSSYFAELDDNEIDKEDETTKHISHLVGKENYEFFLKTSPSKKNPTNLKINNKKNNNIITIRDKKINNISKNNSSNNTTKINQIKRAKTPTSNKVENKSKNIFKKKNNFTDRNQNFIKKNNFTIHTNNSNNKKSMARNFTNSNLINNMDKNKEIENLKNKVNILEKEIIQKDAIIANEREERVQLTKRIEDLEKILSGYGYFSSDKGKEKKNL